jgi:hypothetical protein
MLSSYVKRRCNARILVVGSIGVLAAALVLGLMFNTGLEAEGGGGAQLNKHDTAQGLTVTLHFQKGPNKTLLFTGCSALEVAGTSKQCTSNIKQVARNFSAQAAIQWNGQSEGSGCVIVGGVEFCF